MTIVSLFTLPASANEYDKYQEPFFSGVYSIEFQKTKESELPIVVSPDKTNRGKVSKK